MMTIKDTHSIHLKNVSPSNSHKNQIFAIHGGGNIGLGCMADIVSRSSCKYHIMATSSDQFFNTLINSNHQFWLRHGHGINKKETCVKNVTMIDTKNPKNIQNLYCQSDIVAICLTEKALMNVSKTIAQGLLSRFQRKSKSLKILILMNNINSDRFVRREIKKALLLLTGKRSITHQILNSITLIPTVVDRIVNKIDKKNVLMQLKRQLIALNQQEILKLKDIFNLDTPISSQIEKSLLNLETLPKIANRLHLHFYLFNAEKDLSLCVPRHFQSILNQFPDIKAVDNLNQFAEIKNKYINGPHSMLAWMGGLMGFTTIGEAIDHPSMLWFLNEVMKNEIAPILKAEYPDLKNTDLTLLRTSFIKRCKVNSEDPILRVGRDPLRKLQSGGRIRGVIELKHKHKLKLPTPELERGIAAGILYAVKKIDPNNEECQKIREIYRHYDSYKAILCYQDAKDKSMYSGLDTKQDQVLINSVLRHISSVEKVYKLKTSIQSNKKSH